MADEEIEEEGNSGQAKSSGGGSKVIIIIAVVVLVFLLLVGGVIAFLLSGNNDDEMMMGDAPMALSKNGQMATGKAPRMRVQATSYITVGPIHELDLFLVNLLSKRGKRYLRVKISLELDSENVIGELELKKVVLSDAIIDTLTSRTKEELSTSKGKSRLKDELVSRINSSLVDGTVKNVFFTEFVIQ